jgi:hypothetical protein
MSFTLVIDIRGLCLFAPHEDTMHVLLPDETSHREHHPMGVHLARFHFDPRYNAGGSTRTFEEFANLRWNLADLVASTPVSASLPPVVVDVAQYVRPRGLEKHQLRRGQQVAVKSHLVLNRGKWECWGPVPHFKIGPHADVPMASMLRWVVDMPGEELPWRFRDRDTDALQSPIEGLRPVKGEIRMELLHAPLGEAAEECIPTGPTHFPAYYPLFKANGPMPHCLNKLDDGSCPVPEQTGEEGEQLPAPAPNVFTCMIGRTDMDPTTV